jgi:putative N6-adenine-specific DNA methylase
VNEETNHALFITCATALEPLLMEELQGFGLKSLHMGFRGVYVHDWTWSTIYKINYASRLASRVLLPLSRFRCFDKQSLYKGASLIDWTRYVKTPCSIAIDANVSHRELRNSLFAAQVVKDAICDQLRQKTGLRPNVDVQDPDVQLNLYIQNNMAVISFDTSGAPLHKRGYRQESGEAPLKETLAAAILRLARYDRDDILLDTCCGSGTLLIEAALIASKTPPGYLRHKWGFMLHPEYRLIEWLKIRNELDAHRSQITPGCLFGIDVNKEAVRISKVNLKAAGFLQQVDVSQYDFREYSPTVVPTIIIANPPYGKRMEEAERLAPLYRSLGNFIKAHCSKQGYGYIFTGNLDLAKEVGLAVNKRHVLNNGALDARLLEYQVY